MTVVEQRTDTLAKPVTAGWFEDPSGDHKLRYFNGEDWTSHVTHYGPMPCDKCREK